MMNPMASVDVAIVGAGPTGLSCAIECVRQGLSHVILEKGCLCNSIYHFPTRMVFFTTADLLEIGDMPFTCASPKPTREEGLTYYKRVAQYYQLNIHTDESVLSIQPAARRFILKSRKTNGAIHECSSGAVILATGYFDNPNRLGIPGEDLPKTSHYYSDPHPYFDKDVLIIGGRNSACIAALELHRYGARVTVVHRRSEVRESVKYWILPDFLNRVKEGGIALHVESVVDEIREDSVSVRHLVSGRQMTIRNDAVLALTGYHPDVDFLRQAGVKIDPDTMMPEHDPGTFQTNVPGIYVAGSVSAGRQTNKLFIENGRFHGRSIVRHIQGARDVPG